jgi:hypothetical protein
MAQRLQTEHTMKIQHYLPSVPLTTRLDQLTDDQLTSLEAWLVSVVGFSGMGGGVRERIGSNRLWHLTLGEYVKREEDGAKD